MYTVIMKVKEGQIYLHYKYGELISIEKSTRTKCVRTLRTICVKTYTSGWFQNCHANFDISLIRSNPEERVIVLMPLPDCLVHLYE